MKRKNRSLIESFNYAVTGILSAIKMEKNMRIHYFIALAVVGLSLFFDLQRFEFIVLLFAICLVFIAEMLNTAVEMVVDLVTDTYHPLAKLAKDIAAGAVLIAAINSIIVGYLLFFDRINNFSEMLILKIKRSPIHLTVIALLLAVILTIGLKAIFYRGRGTHFQGGTVSGHSAISFTMATIIVFLANNPLVTTLALGLALLVAESRVEGKIHSLFEVVAGGVLGIIIGVLVFRIVG